MNLWSDSARMDYENNIFITSERKEEIDGMKEILYEIKQSQ